MDIPTMALIVQTCGVVGTLLAATIGVRSYVNSNKRAEEARSREIETRQAQLFMSIFQATTTKDFLTDSEELVHIWKWNNFEDYDTKYNEIINPLDNGKLNAILSYWNGVGVLVQRRLIDPELIYDMKRIQVIEIWEKFSPILREWRSRFSAPQIYIGYEYLVDELRRIRDRRGDQVFVDPRRVQSNNPTP